MVTRLSFDIDWLTAWNRLFFSDPPGRLFFLVICWVFIILCFVIWTDPTGKSKRLSCWGQLIMFDLPCSTFFQNSCPIILVVSYQLLARRCHRPYDPVVIQLRHSTSSRWSAIVRRKQTQVAISIALHRNPKFLNFPLFLIVNRR